MKICWFIDFAVRLGGGYCQGFSLFQSRQGVSNTRREAQVRFFPEFSSLALRASVFSSRCIVKKGKALGLLLPAWAESLF